jgi:probable HAF family extracellular repeat protein
MESGLPGRVRETFMMMPKALKTAAGPQVLLAILLSLIPRIAFAQYNFTGLDVRLGPQAVLSGCAATGINEAGAIVGGCDDANSNNFFRGFLYDGSKFTQIYFPTIKGSIALVARSIVAQSIYQNEAFVDSPSPILRPRLTAVDVTPQDINDVGEVTGWFSDRAMGLHGFIKLHGNISSISVPKSDLTEATGINDAGDVVGDYRSTTDGVFHGFLFRNGLFTTFGSDLGAHDINNTGQIVGCYALCSHGFLLSGAAFTSIDVPGAVSTQATGINDAGQIVGNYYDGTTLHGFIYDGTTFTTIDAPGAFLTSIFRINNAGTIVGYYAVETAPGVYEDRAFVATR